MLNLLQVPRVTSPNRKFHDVEFFHKYKHFYIGICCSLYSPESANVDIGFANTMGITVTGIRDYGDEGVVEYVISELVRCLHGFGRLECQQFSN